MKKTLHFIAALSAIAASVFFGCNRRPDAKSELDKAAVALEKSDVTPPAPLQPAPSPGPLSASPSTESASTPAAPAQQMKDAIAAYKAGNLEDAVTRLQKLRATPVMSPEKRIAVNDAIAAVMNEIGALAAKGDARAIAAAKQFEQMQTERH